MSYLKVGAKVHVSDTIRNMKWSLEGKIVELDHGRIVVHGYYYLWTPCPKQPPADWPYENRETGWGPWKKSEFVPNPWAFRSERVPVTVAIPQNAFVTLEG